MTPTRSRLLPLFCLALGLTATAPARALTLDEKRMQIRQVLTDLATQSKPLWDQVRVARDAFIGGAKAELALSDAQVWILKFQLAGADYRAARALAALPEADRTEAKRKELLLAEYAKVFALYTQDATKLANLDALARTYVDAVVPLLGQLDKLRADAAAAIKAIIAAP